MKNKYFLRGIGVGIIITCIVLSVANSNKKAVMSDEQVIKRATELGMVDGKRTLSQAATDAVPDDATNKESGNTEADITDVDTNTGNAEADVDNTDTDTDNIAVDNVASDESNDKIEETADDGTADEGKTIELKVSSGDGSGTIANKLQALNVIENAKDFDTYLCKNGYDKRLRVGTFTVNSKASYEEIAKILTSK